MRFIASQSQLSSSEFRLQRGWLAWLRRWINLFKRFSFGLQVGSREVIGGVQSRMS
jgi:hypothetical protein